MYLLGKFSTQTTRGIRIRALDYTVIRLDTSASEREAWKNSLDPAVFEAATFIRKYGQ